LLKKEKRKKYFYAYSKISQSLKNHIAFLYNNENFKKIYIYFIMHFGFNNQFIKVMKTLANISKKIKKNILFCFNIGDYEFIRKTYSRY